MIISNKYDLDEQYQKSKIYNSGSVLQNETVYSVIDKLDEVQSMQKEGLCIKVESSTDQEVLFYKASKEGTYILSVDEEGDLMVGFISRLQGDLDEQVFYNRNFDIGRIVNVFLRVQ
jgi:hypothetical protein